MKVLIDDQKKKSFSHREFARNINALAEILKEESSDEWMIVSDNCAELVFLYYAAMLAGYTVIPIDPEKKESEIADIRSLHTGCRFLNQMDLEKLVEAGSKEDVPDMIQWDAIDMERKWLITYTSGSTGKPKGVIHSAGNLFRSAHSFGKALDYGADTVMAHCMPMTYMAGILNTLIMPLYFDGQVVIFPRFSMSSAFSFWEKVREYRCNTIWLSPTMLRILNMMDRDGEMDSYFRESDMKISVGTAPLDRNLRTEFEKKYQRRVYQSYGLSETLFLTTETPEKENRNNTVGSPLEGVEMEFGEDAEIRVRTPWMFYGYVNENTNLYYSGGKYLTGDLGRILSDGNLVITGRKKELILRGGFNLNPRDIERIIMDEGFAEECAVISAFDQGEEKIVCCYVSSFKPDTHAMNQIIMGKLGRHYRIDLFRQMDHLPKNANTKIDKLELAKMIGEKI